MKLFGFTKVSTLRRVQAIGFLYLMILHGLAYAYLKNEYFPIAGFMYLLFGMRMLVYSDIETWTPLVRKVNFGIDGSILLVLTMRLVL